MAGSQGSALAIAVSNAGGLGSQPCAMLGPDALRKELQAIAASTSKPCNVNFFVHRHPVPDRARESAWRQQLAPYFAEYGIDPAAIEDGPARMPFDDAAADVLEDFEPPIVSFHFGLPSVESMRRVKSWGAKVLSSATTMDEARYLEANGVDGVILGGLSQTAESTRDVRATWLDSLARDVRYAVRVLRRSPRFTVTALTLLILGIGSTTAIFSIAHAVRLRPLPYPDAGRLVFLAEKGGSGVAWPTLEDWRHRDGAEPSLAGCGARRITVGAAGRGSNDATRCWTSSVLRCRAAASTGSFRQTQYPGAVGEGSSSGRSVKWSVGVIGSMRSPYRSVVTGQVRDTAQDSRLFRAGTSE